MSKKFLVRLGVTLGLLAFIVTRLDLSAVQLGSPGRVGAGVGLAVLLLVLNQAVTALRWKTVIGRGAPEWSFLFRLTLVGMFFSTFLPTSVGGDAVRAWGLAKEGREPGQAVSTVVVDRAMGLVALVVYLLAGGFVAREITANLSRRLELGVPLWALAAGAAILVPAFVVVARRSRVSAWLRQALTHLQRFRTSKTAVAWAAALSFVVQGIYILVWVVLARAVGFDLPLTTFLFTVPVVSLGAMLPVTLSGLGVREGLWIVVLAQFDLAAATVAAFSLLFFLAFAGAGAIGGLLYLWRGVSPRASGTDDPRKTDPGAWWGERSARAGTTRTGT